jgi:hypothetical protein
MRWVNPLSVRDAVKEIRKITSGGGPQLLRLVRVGEPEGLIVPTVPVRLEVKAKNGRVARFEPHVPVPFPYAWAYRIARHLGVPLVSDLDPRKVKFELRVPGTASG